MVIKKEIWIPVEGYEGLYEVSNLARVRSFPRKGTKTKEVRILRQSLVKQGYLRVHLQKTGLKKYCPFVHVLVARAFIPLIQNKNQVNHKNGIKSDNRIENLEWVDNSENQKHAFLTGLRKYKNGKNHSRARSVARYKNGRMIKRYEFMGAVKRDGFSEAGVCTSIKNGRLHGGFNWKYIDKKAA